MVGGAIRIANPLAVPQAHDGPTFVVEKFGSSSVVDCGIDVLTSVKLDRQFRLTAGNVDDEWPDYQLASEAWAIGAQPQPHSALGLGRMVSQIARIGRQFFIDPFIAGA